MRRHSTLRTLVALAPSVLTSMAVSLAGLWLSRRFFDPEILRESNDVVGNYMQTLGTIYAVLLAFVVFVVWNQFNEARAMVEREANELIDLFRVAKGLPDSERIALQQQLVRYVDAVLGQEWPAMRCGDSEVFERIGRILDEAWDGLHAFDAERECHKAIYAEVLQRFNDLSDSRSSRLSSALTRIPLALRMVLYLGAIATVTSVYLFAVESLAVHAFITAALAGAISHVLYVIRDLDNCFVGDWQVPRESFERVRAYMAEFALS